MDTIITPAEALFAWYALGFESGSTIVYNMPTGGEQTERGTRYRFISSDRRVPVENGFFGRNAEGTPVLLEVEDWDCCS